MEVDFLKKFRKIKILKKNNKDFFFRYLKKIGYCIQAKKKSHTSKILKAFQRHYRKELVNGLLDKECLIIAKNLSKKI